MDGGHGEAFVGLLELHVGGSFERLRREVRIAELCAESHGEAPSVGRRNQFFRIGADTALESR